MSMVLASKENYEDAKKAAKDALVKQAWFKKQAARAAGRAEWFQKEMFKAKGKAKWFEDEAAKAKKAFGEATEKENIAAKEKAAQMAADAKDSLEQAHAA